MDLDTMRSIVRRDLKDEDPGNYRWSNAGGWPARQRLLVYPATAVRSILMGVF